MISICSWVDRDTSVINIPSPSLYVNISPNSLLVRQELLFLSSLMLCSEDIFRNSHLQCWLASNQWLQMLVKERPQFYMPNLWNIYEFRFNPTNLILLSILIIRMNLIFSLFTLVTRKRLPPFPQEGVVSHELITRKRIPPPHKKISKRKLEKT